MTKEQLRTLSDLVSIAHDEYDGCPSYRDDLERYDRLLAEIKAEAQSATGNAAALREALEQCGRALEKAQCSSAFQVANSGAGYIDAALSSAHAALAAPPRNCDVGTAEEQAHRFHAFCSDNTSEIEGMCNSTCPCFDFGDKCHCLCVWSQLPFAPAEGGVR